MKYVLIMWVMNSFGVPTQSAITAEFDSFATCNFAYVEMVKKLKGKGSRSEKDYPFIEGGCFKK